MLPCDWLLTWNNNSSWDENCCSLFYLRHCWESPSTMCRCGMWNCYEYNWYVLWSLLLIARWLDWSLEAAGRLRRTVWLLLRPVTELDNAPAAVDADTSSAVQRDAVVETQLVSLVLVFHVTVRRVRRAASHLCTRSHLPWLLRRPIGAVSAFTHTHSHTRHPFNGPFSGTTRVSRYQKGKPSLHLAPDR